MTWQSEINQTTYHGFCDLALKYNVIQLDTRNEKAIDRCGNMNEFQRHYAEWQKSVSKITYYMIPSYGILEKPELQWQNYSMFAKG